MSECVNCGKEFQITKKQITGGGYGVVGIKCPHCGHEFVESELLVRKELEEWLT